MSWQTAVISDPMILLGAQAQGGWWQVAALNWICFAWRVEAVPLGIPVNEAVCGALNLPLPHRITPAVFTAVFTRPAPVLMGFAGRHYNADPNTGGFLRFLAKIPEERRGEVGVGALRGLAPVEKDGQLLIIGGEDWRLIVQSLDYGAILNLDAELTRPKAADDVP